MTARFVYWMNVSLDLRIEREHDEQGGGHPPRDRSPVPGQSGHGPTLGRPVGGWIDQLM
jgi:hypothetical protein